MLRTVLLGLCLTLIAAAPATKPATPSLRPDAPAHVKVYFSRCQRERSDWILAARADVTAAKREAADARRGRIDKRAAEPTRVDGAWVFPDQLSKDAAVQRADLAIAAAQRKMDGLAASPLCRPKLLKPGAKKVEIGDIGWVDDMRPDMSGFTFYCEYPGETVRGSASLVGGKRSIDSAMVVTGFDTTANHWPVLEPFDLTKYLQ